MQLKDIHSPSDVRRLPREELGELTALLRRRIIDTVAQNGGHLASNLGTVELTVALHRAFDFSADKLVFDVGHQCYAHKLLTGRQENFASLRQYGGMAGFPRREESAYDAFDTGHASTAISAAVGFARARDLQGQNHHVVAVVGDGALTGGMCFEALNDAGSNKLRMIVVLNDNEMSISHNVGAVSKYLTHLRAGKGWVGMKQHVTGVLNRIPVVGKPLYKNIHRIKDSLRSIFVQDRLFDSLGFHYLGPVNGHNIEEMEKLLLRAKQIDGPVLLHVVTRKGQGYQYAEENPTMLHGTPPFDVKTGEPLQTSGMGMSCVAGDELLKLAQQDERVVAITAAMTESTGLGAFAKAYPERLFDVGIAEEHAVTMAAGLACGGLRPFVAIYDTFLQRAYDQLLHDVCAQKLPVCFLIDRAGLSEDGVTHQGIYGLSYLGQLPGMTVLTASSRTELRAMMRYALTLNAPVAVRYGKADFSGCEDDKENSDLYMPCWRSLRPGKDAAILAVGGIGREAILASYLLREQGLMAAVYSVGNTQPLDDRLLEKLTGEKISLVTLEENVLSGGFGEAVAAWCVKKNVHVNQLMLGVEGLCASQGARVNQLKEQSLDAESIARRIMAWKEKQKA